jgi:hypothetical protein
VHARARELSQSGDHAGAVALLRDHLKRSAGDAEAEELLGRALLELGRADEGAHFLEAARAHLVAAGNTRAASKLTGAIKGADPLFSSREALFKSIGKDLARSGEKLHKSGDTARALALLRAARPYVDARDLAQLERTLAQLEREGAQVDLAAAAGPRDEGGARALIERESAHYFLSCNLEPDVVDLVADTMDDIYANYVQIYFDGDASEAPKTKATIRVHGTWEEMAAVYGGAASPGLGGWWSPGSNEVHCYDTRDRGAELDEMLDTLFHEASHQFMTALRRGGSGVPPWLNEGTSTFFEGSVAMADHRVLWPDAALDRLQPLLYAFERPSGQPTLAQVIGDNGPGSYAGSYYAWGWGVVYFLQQWEDPATLEYAYRPLYAEYRRRMIDDGGDSRALFEEVFLGPDTPLGLTTFGAFEDAWREWIQRSVQPLWLARASERRALRMGQVERYVAAADAAAAAGKRARVGPEDLLLRALGHVEYVRTRLDHDTPVRDVLLLQADLLERLGRKRTAAALLEELLDHVDAGTLELPEDEYAALDSRLESLDKRNYDLRSVRSTRKRLVKSARRVLDSYTEKHPELVLRAYTFASSASIALGEPPELAGEALRLRALAAEQGLLLGRVAALAGAARQWFNPMSDSDDGLTVTPDGVRAEASRPLVAIDTSVPLRAPYEIRARMHREERAHLASAYGLVVAGAPGSDWLIVGVNDEGHLALWSWLHAGSRLRHEKVMALERPIAPDASFDLAVRVDAEGRVEVLVDDQEPQTTRLRLDVPAERFGGVFVRDGKLRLEGLVVEIFP